MLKALRFNNPKWLSIPLFVLAGDEFVWMLLQSVAQPSLSIENMVSATISVLLIVPVVLIALYFLLSKKKAANHLFPIALATLSAIEFLSFFIWLIFDEYPYFGYIIDALLLAFLAICAFVKISGLSKAAFITVCVTLGSQFLLSSVANLFSADDLYYTMSSFLNTERGDVLLIIIAVTFLTFVDVDPRRPVRRPSTMPPIPTKAPAPITPETPAAPETASEIPATPDTPATSDIAEESRTPTELQ